MRNPWLIVFQVFFSVLTLISGLVFSTFVVKSSLIDLLFSAIFLLDVLLPFAWYLGSLKSRKVVDLYFVFVQIWWHVLLTASLFKFNIFPSDGSDMAVALVLVTAMIGFRYTVQDSFLKQS